MTFNKILRIAEDLARADKSAVGAINRPPTVIRSILSKVIIGPPWMVRYPDKKVKNIMTQSHIPHKEYTRIVRKS